MKIEARVTCIAPRKKDGVSVQMKPGQKADIADKEARYLVDRGYAFDALAEPMEPVVAVVDLDEDDNPAPVSKKPAAKKTVSKKTTAKKTTAKKTEPKVSETTKPGAKTRSRAELLGDELNGSKDPDVNPVAEDDEEDDDEDDEDETGS